MIVLPSITLLLIDSEGKINTEWYKFLEELVNKINELDALH